MGKLISNHSTVIDLYRQIVMNKKTNNEHITLVNTQDNAQNFITRFKGNYSNAKNCSTGKESRWKKIKDSITKIGFTNEQSKV